MLLPGFILLLSSSTIPCLAKSHRIDDFHREIMSLCDLQDGCSVTLARLSSAAVSIGCSSSAFQTLLRLVLGALFKGICTSTESAWGHQPRERVLSTSNQEPVKLSCLLSVFLTEFPVNHTPLIPWPFLKGFWGHLLARRWLTQSIPPPTSHLRGGKSGMIFLAHSCAINHISSFLISVGIPFYYKLYSFLLVVLSHDFDLLICTVLHISRAP